MIFWPPTWALTPYVIFGYFMETKQKIELKTRYLNGRFKWPKKGLRSKQTFILTKSQRGGSSLAERNLNKKSYCMDILVILHKVTKEWVFLFQIVIVCLSKLTTPIRLPNKQSDCEWNKRIELMASNTGKLSRATKVSRRNQYR